jgi:L-asparagine transporter-like permease
MCLGVVFCFCFVKVKIILSVCIFRLFVNIFVFENRKQNTEERNFLRNGEKFPTN